MNNEGQVLDVEIQHLRWMPVLYRGEPFPWHRQEIPSARARDDISGPQVYRWRLRDTSREIFCSYIGETEKFETRLCAYRIGSGDREDMNPERQRVRAAMKQCERDGGNVELDFLNLDECKVRINGKPIEKRLVVGYHDVRLMMESSAIVAARVEGVKLLNRGRGNAYVNNLLRIERQHPEIRGLSQKLKALLANDVCKPSL